MKGFITNIEKETLENTDYRRVLYTSKYSQLVLMCIKPGQEIGNEMHHLDQFIRVEQGKAKVVLNNSEEHIVEADFAIVIPRETWHNIINASDTDLKIYSIYSPPEHKDKTIHKTKEEEKEEHFDGQTTE